MDMILKKQGKFYQHQSDSDIILQIATIVLIIEQSAVMWIILLTAQWTVTFVFTDVTLYLQLLWLSSIFQPFVNNNNDDHKNCTSVYQDPAGQTDLICWQLRVYEERPFNGRFDQF